MNWISLILQLLTLRKSVQESASMMDTARMYAERGKRAVAAILVAAVAALFFFSSLLVAVLEVGAQIERGSRLGYSGFMVSATILAVLGLSFLGAAWFVGRSEPEPPPPPPASPRTERIKDLLEEFLVGFLQQLSKPGPRSEKKSD